MQVKVDAFKDGNDLILIFKNCAPGLESIINTALRGLITKISDSQAEELLTPPAVIPYKGRELSPYDILIEDGDKGFANLSFLYQRGKIPAQSRGDVSEAMGQYLAERFHEDPYLMVEKEKDENVRLFFKCFHYVIDIALKEKIAKRAGYENFDSFVDNEPNIEVLKSAEAAIIEHFQNNHFIFS